MSLYPGRNGGGDRDPRGGGGGSLSPSGSSLSEAQAKRDTANEKLMVSPSMRKYVHPLRSHSGICDSARDA